MKLEHTIKVGYDRALMCTPFAAREIHEHPIAGVGLEILFDRTFPIRDGEPVGAAGLNSQLRVSFTPEDGFKFHSSDSTATYSVTGYYIEVQPNGPGYSEAVKVSAATFDTIMRSYVFHFDADSHLQNLCYWVEPPAEGRLRP